MSLKDRAARFPGLVRRVNGLLPDSLGNVNFLSGDANQQLRGDGSWVAQDKRLPVAWYRGSTAQSITANTWTRLELSTKVHLDSTYFTFDDANDRIQVVASGLYLVMGRVTFEAGSGGQRYFRFRHGTAGSEISALGRINDSYATDTNELSDTAYIDLQAGQLVALDGYSTGATTTRATNTGDEQMFTQLQVIRLSDWSTPV